MLCQLSHKCRQYTAGYVYKNFWSLATWNLPDVCMNNSAEEKVIAMFVMAYLMLKSLILVLLVEKSWNNKSSMLSYT